MPTHGPSSSYRRVVRISALAYFTTFTKSPSFIINRMSFSIAKKAATMEEEKKEDHSVSLRDEQASTKSNLSEATKKEATTMPSSTNPNPMLPPTGMRNPSFSSNMGRFVLYSTQTALFLCFLALAAVYCLRSIHDDYFVTILQRARRTDDDLLEEYTYYDRECNVADISTNDDPQQLFIRPDSKNYGVDQMMTHGAVLFPDLLSAETVQQLRQFVVDKNAAIVGTSAEFPMSQGYKRISFGIEATEHPAVIRALRQIHDNIELQHLLEGLLGENPALTEITAITSQYGCEAQAWHPDVKPDGNAVMFGRTYSHSYSLFIPLQDTTAAMGATDLCAGTHYCARLDLHELCDDQKIGMHQVSGQGYWPAGSAALLNQQVWHRGTEHTDPDASERVLFVVSFLARPNDTRQLSRGTYFHMKWNMWGHTWADLSDPLRFMSWPWNILTCLHIWRTPSHGWGVDLITASAMRIANRQLGCEPEDLDRFLEVLDRVGFPAWLDGTIDTEDEAAWEIYIRETLANYWNFFVKVNQVALGIYFGWVVWASIRQKWYGLPGVVATLWGRTKGVFLTHLVVVILAADALYYVRNTPWAQDLSAGRTLMRPFPPIDSTLVDDPAVSNGPTTLPNRRDVLFGSRLDARTIGAYNRWLEFHPGNREFLQRIAAMGGAPIYRSYVKGLPPIFAQAVVNATMEPILSKGGRFLQQDYRTGDWLLMQPQERDAIVQQALYIGMEGPLYAIRKELDFVLGDARFGYSRETSMARTSLAFLRDVDAKLFGRFVDKSVLSSDDKQPQGEPDTTKKVVALTMLTPVRFVKPLVHRNKRDWIDRWTAKPLELPQFIIGEELMYKYISKKTGQKVRKRVTLVGIHEDADLLDIAFYGENVYQYGVTKTVPYFAVEKVPPLHEGSWVWANYHGQGYWYPATILAMSPDGFADIEYTGFDEVEEGVPPDQFTPRYQLAEETQ